LLGPSAQHSTLTLVYSKLPYPSTHLYVFFFSSLNHAGTQILYVSMHTKCIQMQTMHHLFPPMVIFYLHFSTNDTISITINDNSNFSINDAIPLSMLHEVTKVYKYLGYLVRKARQFYT
jgi:hypothetical protein